MGCPEQGISNWEKMGKMRRWGFEQMIFVFFCWSHRCRRTIHHDSNRSRTQALIAEMKSGWWFQWVLWKNQTIFGMVPNDPVRMLQGGNDVQMMWYHHNWPFFKIGLAGMRGPKHCLYMFGSSHRLSGDGEGMSWPSKLNGIRCGPRCQMSFGVSQMLNAKCEMLDVGLLILPNPICKG